MNNTTAIASTVNEMETLLDSIAAVHCSNMPMPGEIIVETSGGQWDTLSAHAQLGADYILHVDCFGAYTIENIATDNVIASGRVSSLDFAELVTSSEAATIAGITPATFRTLASRNTTKSPIPTPAYIFRGTRFWHKYQIQEWAAQRDNKRGRARRDA